LKLTNGEIRICSDHGLVIFDEERVQLSKQQVPLLVALHSAGGSVTTAVVHRVLFDHQGALTGSQRATVSGLLRRWAEQGIIDRGGRSVTLTKYGQALAKDVAEVAGGAAYKATLSGEADRRLAELLGRR